MYTIMTDSGEWEIGTAPTLKEAVKAAQSRMEDDPEIGDLAILDEKGDLARRVAFAPDEYWDTVIRVFMPGEAMTFPGGYPPRRITEEDLEGYELEDPKRYVLSQQIGEWI